ncbi:hypothetical protein GCM10009007_11090 [Formosimonas limnophila]|uniref:Lipoprotein n=1 Tax=Formosimonas limnophila TaxID=1384487 RepID=A0A8J3CND1_9BURK|nr:hypothetical protein [Formosimonas limnophila]GHA71942.1 hypothetical protein GCM10009007_11090 [Formosimonas limnophila]
MRIVFYIILVLSLTGCAAISENILQDKPSAGYEPVVEIAYKGSGGGMFKYYIAPESKYEHKIDSINSVHKNIETTTVMVVSVAKSFPHGGVQYYTKGYACMQQPGTTFTKRTQSSKDWDPRFQIAPFGTADWHIWKTICN